MSETPGWTSPSPEDTPPPPAPGWGAPPPPGPPPSAQGWSGAAAGAPSWGAQPSGYPGAPHNAKPGVIPLRPLGLGEILDGAITTMRTYPRATLGFAAVVAAVTQLLSFFLLDTLIRDASTLVTQEDFDAFAAEAVTFVILLALIGVLASLILSGCLTAVIGQAVLGRPVSLSEAWSRVRPRIWALIGTALLGMLIVIGGLLLAVLPGIYFLVAFSLATPALILEGQSVTKSLRRSWDLVKGSWWRIFGILLLTYIIAGIVGQILEIPFASIAGGGLGALGADEARQLTTSDLAWASFAGVVSSTITGPFLAGVTVLLYVDRRMRREGLDVTLAANAAQQSAGPQAPGAPGSQYPTA